MVGRCFIQGPSSDMNVVDPSYSSVRYLVTLFSQSSETVSSKTCFDSNNSNATTVLFDSQGITQKTCFASFSVWNSTSVTVHFMLRWNISKLNFVSCSSWCHATTEPAAAATATTADAAATNDVSLSIHFPVLARFGNLPQNSFARFRISDSNSSIIDSFFLIKQNEWR